MDIETLFHGATLRTSKKRARQHRESAHHAHGAHAEHEQKCLKLGPHVAHSHALRRAHYPEIARKR